MRTVFDLDQLQSMPPRRAGKAAMHVLTAVQNLTPEEQLAAIAVSFHTLIDKWRAHPGTILQTARNMMERARGERPELRAVQNYVKHELN